MPHDDHEAEVTKFLAAARMSDPERYAVTCSKYPVKSRRQMRSISEIEIPVGLYPGKLWTDHSRSVAGVTPETFAENTLLEEGA